MKAEDRPDPAETRRARTTSSPGGSRSATSLSAGSERIDSGTSKVPSTHASSAPGLTVALRGRPPISRSSECASTVLPAPVSPVITFSPGPKRISVRSMSRRFSIRSSRSIDGGIATAARRIGPLQGLLAT